MSSGLFADVKTRTILVRSSLEPSPRITFSGLALYRRAMVTFRSLIDACAFIGYRFESIAAASIASRAAGPGPRGFSLLLMRMRFRPVAICCSKSSNAPGNASAAHASRPRAAINAADNLWDVFREDGNKKRVLDTEIFE